MIVLALDLARRTGWAAGKPCGPVAFGHFTIHDARDERRFLEMCQIVTRLIDAKAVTLMVCEAPFVGQGQRANTLMPLFGYRAAAYIASANKGVRVADMVTPATVRKHFVGHGGQKRAAAKKAVIEKCQWRGWQTKDEDEADALALWDYQCALLDPQHFAMGMRRGAFTASEETDGLQRQEDRP